MSGEAKEERRPTRIRSNIHKSVQTEASFVPSCIDLKYAYEADAAEQFEQLRQLREMTQKCLEEVAGSVYDVVSFKDIMFKIEEEFPTSLPVTDMLLLTSKLFRKTSELSRLLGCFFGVVFSDAHADEHFHFCEIRLLQRELLDVKRQLKESEEEKLRLQETLNNVGQVALDHGKAVELLESHNQALQLQTSALEDQMALLFHQVNTDLETHCKDAYEKVTMDMEMQERMNPTRTNFRQTMDSLSQQIRSSRTIISDVREVLTSCSQGSRTGEAYLAIEPSVRFKLKMLDSNFQQLVGRFTAVKDTVVETAHELMNALHERKRILYLSFQHIRLYDLQAKKLRAGKAIMTQIRHYTGDLLQRMQATFPTGAITSVDRIGRITTQRWHGGYTLAALRQSKADNGAPLPPLPGLDEAQIMAAESELAALEGTLVDRRRDRPLTSTSDSLVGGGGGILPPMTTSMRGSAAGTGEGGESVGMSHRSSSARERLSSAAAGGATAAVGFDTAASDAVPFQTLHELLELVRNISTDIDKLNGSLTLEDEMTAFLKTLTLSVSSTARPNGEESGLEQYESNYEQALMPTGGLTSYKQNNAMDSIIGKEQPESTALAVPSSGASAISEAASADTRLTRAEQAHSDALLARQAQQLQRHQEQLTRLQDDFAYKLGFLRQVYEARIADLEIKESTATKPFADTTTKRRVAKQGGKNKEEFALVRHMNSTKGEDDDLLAASAKTDREELLATRGEWRRTKLGVHSTRKLREATTKEIDTIESKIEEKRDKKRSTSSKK